MATGPDPHIEEITAADLLGEYPAVRYYPPTGDWYFDVLTRLGEFASFETVDAETRDVDGTRVTIATPAALYRLKKDTLRPKDHQDMSLQKFRSVEEMDAAPRSDPRLSDFDRLLRYCARYWAIAPKMYPRGVFKFRTLEDAQQARDRH